MRSVGVSSSIPATKGSAELNYHYRKELKELSDGGAFNGQRLSEEDESRINEDVNGSRPLELVKPQDVGQRQHPQPQGPLVQWERFLPLRSLKVLLVEDDDCTRHVVSALLRNCSYEVTAVANGLEAWKVLIDLNKQIDLILTEVVMPYLSGVGLLTKIMNLVPRKNIPVIMMSTDDSISIVFNCLSKGAVDFLVKPIRKNELKNLWQHVWRKCHSSSCSESESGIHAQKHTKARNDEVSDEVSDDSDEDDDTSIGLTSKDRSDNGSGNQSSWSRRAVEVESAKHSWDQLAGPHDSTCAQVIRPRSDTVNTEHAVENDKLDTVAMWEDLEIGVPRNSEKIIESNLKEVSEPRTVSTNNVMISKASSKGLPALELSLKRPRDMEDTDTSTHKRNVLRQSDLSAFSRYNTSTSNGNQAPTGNVGSCSPPDVTTSSEAPKPVNIQSISNAPKQHSNNSSTHNNDMGSSTNNTFTKPEPPVDDKAIHPGPCEGDKAQFQVRHHHHHYHHHHHHVHKTQQQEMANQDDGSSRNTMSNVLPDQDEGNAANYLSASGSNNKSNRKNNRSSIQKCDTGVAKKVETGNGSGTGSGQGSGVDQDRVAQREAALIKFRQKRKERCFEKKVRYQSRKKLAEQRPRVRGQFVRQGVNGKDADL